MIEMRIWEALKSRQFIQMIEGAFWEKVRSADFRDEVSRFASKSAKEFAIEIFKWALPVFLVAWSAVMGMAIYNIKQMNDQMMRLGDSIYSLKQSIYEIDSRMKKND